MENKYDLQTRHVPIAGTIQFQFKQCNSSKHLFKQSNYISAFYIAMVNGHYPLRIYCLLFVSCTVHVDQEISLGLPKTKPNLKQPNRTSLRLDWFVVLDLWLFHSIMQQ